MVSDKDQLAIQISDATDKDFPDIITIAFATWPSTYGEIISQQQLDYMLGLFYNVEALHANVAGGQHFLIAKHDDRTVGFASYQNNYKERNATHIHKLYVLPEMQGLGIGRDFVEIIEQRAKLHQSDCLSLNVNRFNSAKSFYIKIGFSIREQVDIELDHGYLMQDFIMQKLIS